MHSTKENLKYLTSDTETIRDTILYVDLDRLKENVTNIRELITEDVNLLAVVKANAYGLGAIPIVKALTEIGVEHYGVATLSEALELRENFEHIDILIMGATPDRLLPTVVEHDITQGIFSLEQAKKLDLAAGQMNKKAKVHIKVDTGFHRLGFPCDTTSLLEILEIIKLPNIEIQGIFSHLALNSYDDDVLQVDSFNNFVDNIESEARKSIEGASSFAFPIRHIADSIAAVDYPEFRMDMVRVGALLYGMVGFHKGYVEVNPIMLLTTKISQLHTIKAGEGVSYDFTWRAECDSIVATIPIGYADGIPRKMSNAGYVTVNGHKAPIVGLICMDQCVIDVTNVPNIADTYQDAEVIIYGDKDYPEALSINEVSKLASTNKNDILSRLSLRIPRVYKGFN